MNCCRETTKMGVPPGATTGCWFRGVPERYVAGADTRGRQEGRSYPWSQQVIHEISGLASTVCFKFEIVLLTHTLRAAPPLAYGLHLATDGLKNSFSTSPDKLHASTARREGLVWHTKIFFIFSRTWAKIPHA